MPFKSERQKRFMFAKHPDIANRWVREANKKGVSVVQKDNPDSSGMHVMGADGKKRGRLKKIARKTTF